MGKDVYILLLLPVTCFCLKDSYMAVKRDPCETFVELKNISSRSPNFKGQQMIHNDVFLPTALYAPPAGWELLSHAPDTWMTCGTKKPIYRTACTERKPDILIISDASRPIGSPTFDKIKQFQQSLLRSINISQDTDAVALMEFSETPRVLIALDSPSAVREADVLSMINQQQYENGPSTDLADALDMAVTEVFTAQKGDRADADNMVILFTDGWLYKSEKEDVAIAIGQLSAKAEVIVVASKGVNSGVRKIASEPKDDHIFLLDGNNEVENIKGKIMPCSLV